MSPLWAAVGVRLLQWAVNAAIARSRRADRQWARGGEPELFGTAVLVPRRGAGAVFEVSPVILPAPTAIAAACAASAGIHRDDWARTVAKGALSGSAIGCAAAFAAAAAIDRSEFLARGLLPVGNFVTALPIVGTAPILVGWFGFDWRPKAAAVVAMVFIPVLANTAQGLREASSEQMDLMRTYAASPGQMFLKPWLPAAIPVVFSGQKPTTTLALIRANVAEYFGSPTKGMGFRISTGVGSLSIDLVWAEIAVAAATGSAAYGLVSLAERSAIFWQPSQRNQDGFRDGAGRRQAPLTRSGQAPI